MIIGHHHLHPPKLFSLFAAFCRFVIIWIFLQIRDYQAANIQGNLHPVQAK